MRIRVRAAFFAAAWLSAVCAAGAQAPVPGLALDAAIAGPLAWGEDDMGFPVMIAVHNKSDAEAKNLAANAILIARADMAKAGRILHDLCPDRPAGGAQAGARPLAPGEVRQIRFQSNTSVEGLEPETDALPMLLICAHYDRAGAAHKSAIFYRVFHSDPAQGMRPIDRVTGDVPAQALKLEELGRSAD